ncbi:hypothetical protein ACVWYH_003318 [Bradyrhizobium sp. GM24.11]
MHTDCLIASLTARPPCGFGPVRSPRARRQRVRCDADVSAWYASNADADIFLSTLVLARYERASNSLAPRHAAKAAA